MAKIKKKETPFAEEWDLSEGMGILPADIPFTQNVGCVGGKNKKQKTRQAEFGK